ncbi:MAG TPA: replicative DNA helicase [Candidatus Onthousia faecavium]|nr:replicative DNA helicase [Candidatus Onthousia faecavium]
MALKPMPQNLDAEKSVLGSCFLSPNALLMTIESLDETDFFDERNQKIFKALKVLAEEKTPVDLTTITTTLTRLNYLTDIGGVSYLIEITNFVPTAANIEYYLKEVNNTSILRRLIETATDIATSGYNLEENVNDILDQAERKILTIVKNRKGSEFKTIQSVLVKTEEDLQKLAEAKGEITGIPSGWYDIDKVTAGLHENELIILAARPGMGKTAFALNLATYITTHTDKSVAVFNLEMGAEQLANRIISSLGQIEGYKLRTGKMLNNDWKRFDQAVSRLNDAKLYIDDTPGITIGEIRAKCRRLASSTDGLDLVIIDYLQLISGGKNYGANRQQEVADISRSLKTLAMELHIPVIALAQLSRSVEGREDKRPMLSDLRESGSIEQDADLVGFLYRDDYYTKEAKNDATSISEFIIAKHRSGPQATIQLLFKKDTSTFLNMSKNESEVE